MKQYVVINFYIFLVEIKAHIEKLSGKEKKPSLRKQLAKDKEAVNAAPKKAAKTKKAELEV